MSLACYEIHKTKVHFKNASRIFHMLVCFYNSTFKGNIYFVLLMLIPEHTKLYLIFFTFVTSWAVSNSEVHHLCICSKIQFQIHFWQHSWTISCDFCVWMCQLTYCWLKFTLHFLQQWTSSYNQCLCLIKH